MPETSYTNNPFLQSLLCLQQDGNQAISAPNNWIQTRPLLQVETELDTVVRELADRSLGAPQNQSGQWHFFIGSPGNGKSAAVGELIRIIIEDRSCNVVDEHGTNIEDLGSDSVPYYLDVYEPGNRFSSLRVVQDASVVRNPYAHDVDPAKDLLDTLQEAWDKGISLVVCTNRGVLEKAYRDTYANTDINRRTWHKAILSPLADHNKGEALDVKTLSFDSSRKNAFSTIDARATFLDNRSLMLGGRDILGNLIKEAVSDENWKACVDCKVAQLCPFKANRDWLSDNQGRESIVKLFQRAEVLSSQVIVFREALAAISFMLAGCGRDYDNTSPCGWVHQLVERGDLFGLLSRRLYACIFMSFNNRGLELSPDIQEFQISALTELREVIGDESSSASKAITSILNNPAPSTDVGVSRLFGADGVFSRLDAIKGPLAPSFVDRWDGNYVALQKRDTPGCGELESRCAEIWNELEDKAEALGSHEASRAYWAVRRWSSGFTLHIGALQESSVVAGNEIDEFTELLSLLDKHPTDRTIEDRRRLQYLEQLVENLLNRENHNGFSSSALHLADNVEVDGRWIAENLHPHISPSPASGSLTVAVRFGAASDYTTLPASTYLWLKQRARGTIDPRCIPDDLLDEAMNAKARAAAKSAYAFAPDNVTLRVLLRSDVYELSRFDGEVDPRVQS